MDKTVIQNPQPKPIRGICFPRIFLPDHKIPDLKRRDATSLAILKYFPKHIDRLPYRLSHSNLKTRIKHLKIIKRIPDHRSNNTLRTLFANKRKQVKFANGVENQEEEDGYDKYSLQLFKMFPNIQRVEFYVAKYFTDEDGSKWQAEQYCLVDKMSRYLRKMPNLKYLDLSNYAGSFAGLLSKINSFETMLNHLEVFKLSFEKPSLQDVQALLNFPKIVKNLTHFILSDSPLYVNILQCLQDFQNLRKLYLSCSQALDAFRNCKFPISLRSLELYFRKADWQSLVTKEAFLDELEGLENLENLEIRCRPTEEEENIFQDFIQQFLKKTPSLKEFELTVPTQNPSQNSPRPLDMSRFLSFFQHLSQSLQRLTFYDLNPLYIFTNLENAQAFHFPELSYLRLQGQGFSSLHVLENSLALVQTKPDAPAPEIKFEIKIDSSRSVLELLNSVKRIPGKKIGLSLIYENKGEDEDDGYFKENYEQVKQSSENLKNVSLIIMYRKGNPKWKTELESLKGLFESFWD